MLPCQFEEQDSVASLGLKGDELITVLDLENVGVKSRLSVKIMYADGRTTEITVLARLDTAIELQYYRHGGILPLIFRSLLN